MTAGATPPGAVGNAAPGRLFWCLFAALAVLSLLPLGVGELLPAVDCSTHLSMLRALRLRFSDPQAFHAAYGTRLVQPYWGFYLPVLLLSAVTSLDVAGKIVLALTQLSVPLAVLLIARRERVDPRVSLLAFPLLYSFSYYWGFFPYLAATSVALLALLATLRFAEQGTLRSLAALHATSLLVFVAHATAWALWVGWSGWLVVTARQRRWSLLAKGASAALLPAVLFVLWQRSTEVWGNLAYVRDHPGRHQLWFRLQAFAHVAFPSVNREIEYALLALFVVALVVALARSRNGATSAKVRWGGLALLSLAGYWIVPQDVGGLSFVYQRFLVFAPLFALLCAGSVLARPRLTMALACVVSLLGLFFHSAIAVGYNREMEGARRCLRQATPRTRLVGLMVSRGSRHIDIPLFLHADNYHSYWNLGRVHASSMEQLPTTPVYSRPLHVFPTPVPLLEWRPLSFRYDPMGKDAGYFLVRAPQRVRLEGGGEVPFDRVLLGAGWERAQLVCASGPWRLYLNRRAVKAP
jgi:hypothetical protein